MSLSLCTVPNYSIRASKKKERERGKIVGFLFMNEYKDRNQNKSINIRALRRERERVDT